MQTTNVNYLRHQARLNTRHNSKINLDRRQILTWLIGAVLLTSILGAGGSLVWESSFLQASSDQVAKQANLYSVLIDSSDPLSDYQQKKLDYILKTQFINNLNKGDQLLVATLNADRKKPLKWLFNEIDPGKGSEANVFFETPSFIDARRLENFLKPYYMTIDQAQTANLQAFTPLITGIELMSKDISFQGNSVNQINYHQKVLLIVSDGLENSDFSVYKKNIYTKAADNYLKIHQANLRNVNVIFCLINRPQYQSLQTEKHWQWLENYLKASNALTIKRINLIG